MNLCITCESKVPRIVNTLPWIFSNQILAPFLHQFVDITAELTSKSNDLITDFRFYCNFKKVYQRF